VWPLNLVLAAITVTALTISAVSIRAPNRYLGLLVAVLGATGLVLNYLNRSTSELRRRYSNLEHLYRFARLTSGGAELSDTIRSCLVQARDAMDAALVQIELTHGDGLMRYRLGSDGRVVRRPCSSLSRLGRLAEWSGSAILVAEGDRQRDIRAALSELGLRDAIAAPLSSTNDPRGVLIVGDRLGPVGFDIEDRRLFEVLLNHSALAIRGSLLLDHLKYQAAVREHDALHDNLTGLANRSLFERSVRAALSSREEERMVAVMLMDLDGFKDINDTMGHHAGDSALRELGQRLCVEVAGEGTAARLGGDEFAFVVPNVADIDRISELAAVILLTVIRPIEIDGTSLRLQASLGISVAPEHGAEASVLMRRADVAMYTAKSAGGAGVAYYDIETDPDYQRRARRRTNLSVVRSPDDEIRGA
jgi:diguanylate cyclase (GGDEF)-like protein